MNYKEELQQKIWPWINQISVAKISKVSWKPRYDIQSRIYWNINITPNYYNIIMEAYEFIMKAQNTVYKR